MFIIHDFYRRQNVRWVMSITHSNFDRAYEGKYICLFILFFHPVVGECMKFMWLQTFEEKLLGVTFNVPWTRSMLEMGTR